MQKKLAPKIYIINLEDSSDRRVFMETQFDKINELRSTEEKINFSFFPAIYGKKEPNHPVFKLYNPKKRLLRKGRDLTLAQLGCFASHYLIWQQCIKENKTFIVLEDDVKLVPEFTKFYDSAYDYAEQFGFLWLHKNYRKSPYCVIDNKKIFSVIKYYREYVGTLGYLLTPEYAQKLINAFQEVIYPVDDQMARFYENGIENFAIYPPLIEIEDSLDSTISSSENKQKTLSFLAKLRREYFNLKDKIARYKYNKKYF